MRKPCCGCCACPCHRTVTTTRVTTRRKSAAGPSVKDVAQVIRALGNPLAAAKKILEMLP